MSLRQFSHLLPLPDDELQQVLDYAKTLSKSDAASHFENLLGDSPLAVDFIASFNSSREDPSKTRDVISSATQDPIEAVPKSKKAPKKKQVPALHTPEARQISEYAAPSGAVLKKSLDADYMRPQRRSAPSSHHASGSSTPRLSSPDRKPPANEVWSQRSQSKQHASSNGFLISDVTSRSKTKSTPASRSSTPKPAATKVSIAGGQPMGGQSAILADFDAAIRALETSTNPSLNDVAKRRCSCVATRHPLQGAAPNCLACGKVICIKEGLGPCTFCGSALLASDEVQAMVRELKDQRGRERMAADRNAHRKADVGRTPPAFTRPRGDDSPSLSEAVAKAREHRDRLLEFQAQNARRTTVRDEAADFDVSEAMAGNGGSVWATPEDRARELKRQQKLMREMEWNARPDYEKRRQVISIDLVGGKVVRKMTEVERPSSPDEDEADAYGHTPTLGFQSKGSPLSETSGNVRGGGAFSGNPLLGSLIKPVVNTNSQGAAFPGRQSRKAGWRRVQHDLDDNENVILDGGILGHQSQSST